MNEKAVLWPNCKGFHRAMEAEAAHTAASLIAQIDQAISEKWLITSLRVTAPVEGSVSPAGTTIDVLIGGKAATAGNSDLALKTARATYQAALDDLTAQLEVL